MKTVKVAGQPEMSRQTFPPKKNIKFNMEHGKIPLVEDVFFLLKIVKMLRALPLKIHGWNVEISFWGLTNFQGRTVRFREAKL